MKKSLSIIAASLISISTMAQAPAFPGAEGHGRFVTGGRGCKIYHVTNLNDSGTGSFREAVKSGKRIIVFDVAGVIALKSDLKIADNITILGQTAPSPGITLRYYTVQPGSNNIIRFIRIRRGQEKNINDGADASWQRNKTGIIFDHCSFSWSIDEVASFYDNNNFTMQWCTVAESLTNPGHSKGAHGYGGIWGGKLASFHHNFVAHLMNRGPRFNGARYGWTGYTSNKEYSTYKWQNAVQAENVDFRNCVMYNAQGTCYGGPGGGQINIVNNYYKAGPSHSLRGTTLNGLKVDVSTGKERGSQDRITLVTLSTKDNSDKNHPELYDMTSRYYINGNTTEDTTCWSSSSNQLTIILSSYISSKVCISPITHSLTYRKSSTSFLAISQSYIVYRCNLITSCHCVTFRYSVSTLCIHTCCHSDSCNKSKEFLHNRLFLVCLCLFYVLEISL